MAAEPFRQYRQLIRDTARISDRRQTVNTFFISANSILLGAIALIFQQGISKGLSPLYIVAIIAAAGVVVCLEWRTLIQNYRALLKFRLNLLKQIEEMPSFDAPVKTYQAEDKEFYAGNRAARQLAPFGFSRVEGVVPVVFQVVYILVVIGMAVAKYGELATALSGIGITLPH